MPEDQKFALAIVSLADMIDMLTSLPRRHMVEIMFNGEVGVGDLSQRIGLSQSAVSQHLMKMRRAGVVAYRKDRQSRYYEIADGKADILRRLITIADAHALRNKK